METQAQAVFLHQSGCNLLQDFYDSRSVSREDFERMIPCGEMKESYV